MNRKGVSELIMFIPFAFILVIIICGGIFLAVQAFYGNPYEMRLVESQILASRIESCLTNHDFFSSEFSISDCRLFAESFENRILYVKRGSDGKEWFLGVYDFVNQCQLSEKNLAYPRCVSGSIVKEGVVYEYLAGSNQLSSNP